MGQVWEFRVVGDLFGTCSGLSVFLSGAEVEQSIKECLHLGGCRGLPSPILGSIDRCGVESNGFPIDHDAAHLSFSTAIGRSCLDPPGINQYKS